jgi:hypothetical protein
MMSPRRDNPLKSDSGYTCPRCQHAARHFDVVGIIPELMPWLAPMRRCPACRHIFALRAEIPEPSGPSPLKTEGGYRCPRCRHEGFFGALGMIMQHLDWLVPVRRCPECGMIFAPLDDDEQDLE